MSGYWDVWAGSDIFISPELRLGAGPQYICDQGGWGEFRMCYTLDDVFF